MESGESAVLRDEDDWRGLRKMRELAVCSGQFAAHLNRMGRGLRTIALIAAFILMGPGSVRADDYASQVSAYRRSHGLPPVQSDAGLNSVAATQARAMASSNALNHTAAGSFASRIRGVAGSRAAENVAAGSTTFAATLKQWQRSAGHRRNLLMKGATRIGVGHAENPQSRYRMFWALVITK